MYMCLCVCGVACVCVGMYVCVCVVCVCVCVCEGDTLLLPSAILLHACRVGIQKKETPAETGWGRCQTCKMLPRRPRGGILTIAFVTVAFVTVLLF